MYTADEVAARLRRRPPPRDDRAHGRGPHRQRHGRPRRRRRRAAGVQTIDAGVDVLSFGGTKNGLVGGEAVVFLRPELARRAMYIRKQVTQLPSKMRFVAAQFLALLDDDLWLRSAGHANAMATELHRAVAGIRGRRRRRRPAGQQPVPGAATRADRAAAGRGASSGTGTSPATRCAG